MPPYRTVVAVAWDHITSSEIKTVLQSERINFKRMASELDTGDSHTRFEFLLDDLDREGTSFKDLDAYEGSVKWLSLIYDNPDYDYVFKFAAKASQRFVELLMKNDPRALTIVGYWFMLLASRERVWWLPCCTSKDFEDLMRLLPEEWKSRMQWAVEEFENCAE